MPNTRIAPRSWLLNPWLQLAIGGVCDSLGELLLKKGANAVAASGGGGVFGITALGNVWTWLGIASYVTGLLCWLYVLKHMQLNIAFAVLNVLRLLVPIGAAVILHEHVSRMRWFGIALAGLGVFLIVKPLAAAEEKL